MSRGCDAAGRDGAGGCGGGDGARTGTCCGCGTDADGEAMKTSGGISLSSIVPPARTDLSNS